MGKLNATSIKQSPRGAPGGLPDLRNLGVILRLLAGGNLVMVFAVVARVPPEHWVDDLLLQAAWCEPVLLLLVAFGGLGHGALRQLPVVLARALLVLASGVFAWLVLDAARFMNIIAGNGVDLLRPAALAAATMAGLLGYFALRARALPPAVAEARLQALTARIRPHFLFNSLNAVLSLIRSEPRRAEAALEEMADLFRVLMAEHRALSPLSDEIALARQYLALEKLRLGERLQVTWDIERVPPDALVPPLMLQPLLENAVYHGIEPQPGGGEVAVRCDREGNSLVITLTNPLPPPDQGNRRESNHLALANIRERLSLYFDLEAQFEARAVGGRWCVRIVLPYRHEAGECAGSPP